MAPSVTVWTSRATAPIESRAADFVGEALDGDGSYTSLSTAGCSAAEAVAKINSAFDRVVRMTMSDTTMHLIAVIPAWEADSRQQVETLAEACSASAHRVSLHILALCGGLKRIFATGGGTDTAAEGIESCMRELSEKSVFPFSYSLVDDYAENGAPIGFDSNSLARYLATFQAAVAQNYYAILSPALISSHPHQNLSVGLSSLGFNLRATATQLLGLGFISALDKVGINRKEVDAQKAANTAENFLKGIERRYPALFEREIKPLYHDNGADHGTAVANAAKILDTDIAALRAEVLGLLDSPDLTFPEREAVLAMILGRDNENVRGLQYEHEGMLLDDVCTGPIDTYVNAFNECCTGSGLLPVRGNYQALKKYLFNRETGEIEESPENELALNPLPDIKRLKQTILNTTAFIREKTDEVADLQQAEAHRRSVEEVRKKWHRPAGNRDLPPCEEQPLADKYLPTPGLKVKDAIDMRKFFSPVRDQDNLGACTSFAVAAMYEALMNMRSDSHDAVMSPAYLYYHTNIANGRARGGSNFYEQLEALAQRGICFDNLHRYDPANPALQPTPQADADAATHRLLKARQIALSSDPDKTAAIKANHSLITSALSEGYPVGISLRVFDNFGSNGAFVIHPEETPDAVEENRHAMVIAGYSEEGSFYIVRNSWGPDFGEDGYCYIPMAYIDDSDYMDFACIITEITDGAGGEAADIPAVVANFAATETEIRMAAIRNVISKARVELRNEQKRYAEYYKYYQRLVQQLTMPGVQNQIREAAEHAQTEKWADAALVKQQLENSFVDRLKEFKKHLRYTIFVLIFSAAILTLLYYYLPTKGLLISASIAWVAGIFAWLGYKWNVRIRRRQLQEELDENAVETHRQEIAMKELQIRFHVAGMWLSRFHKLSNELGNVYERLVSYNSTLRAWHSDYSAVVARHEPDCGQMFRHLDATPLLPAFFEANKDTIVSGIDLFRLFGEYQVDPQSLDKAHAKLRDTVTEAIASLLRSFSLTEFLQGRRYPYLEPVNLSEEMATLIAVGQPSFRNSSANASPSTYFVLTDVDHTQRAGWEAAIAPLFPIMPISLDRGPLNTLILLTIHPIR